VLGIQNLSIRSKVILVTTICSSLALVLSATGFVMHNVRTMRDSKVEEIRTQARIIGFNSTAVLTFQDSAAAAKLLAALKSQPSVEFACLIDEQGNELACYEQNEHVDGVYINLRGGREHEFTHDGYLHVYERIEDDGNVVGTLFLRASMMDLQEKLRDYAKIAAIVLLCAMAAILA
jgi:hypothetical protein